MAVVTISRGSYSYGKAIAEKIAEKLGYTCIAREVLIEASKEFNIPEVKLVSAAYDAPSFLDRLIGGKEKYMAYIQAALLKYLQKDNVVYHGFGGMPFLREIPHVLKVRIAAAIEDRIRLVIERDHVSRKKALSLIKNMDKQRKKWSLHLHGIDIRDSSLYDLVLQVGKLTVDDIVDIICHSARLERFRTTPESQQAMDDLCLAMGVKAALIEIKRDIQVSAREGIVTIDTTILESKAYETEQKIRSIVETIPDVKGVKVNFISIPAYSHAGLDI